MSKPVCLTTALPFLCAASGAEPRIEDMDVRVLRGLPADAPWPEDDAERG